MKILMTGFTTRMGGEASNNFYLSTSFLLKEILVKQLGHDVDHRRVTPGEGLDGYDLVLLGICPSGSYAARAAYVAGTAWAFEKRGQTALLFCEDWQIEEAGTDFRSTLRRWPKHAEFKKYPATEENRIQAMLTSILSQPWPLLATFFPWGNHYLLLSNNLPARLFEWDPSPFCRFPDPGKFNQREKRWAYATLQNHDKWLTKQRLVWPVDRYVKGSYVPEEQLLTQEYSRRWGVLAPRYKTASSGWWRVRFNHAAHTGAVIVCDWDDAQVMGRPYRVSPRTVELMSVEELVVLAQQQRDWFLANIASREQTLVAIDNALRAAVGSPELRKLAPAA